MRWTWIAAVVAVGLLGLGLLPALFDDDDDSDATPTAPRRTSVAGTATPSDRGLPTPTPGVTGTAVITVDGATTELRVQQCVLSDDAILVVGNQGSPAASLTVVSVAGSTTITFNRESTQWGAAAARMTVNGNTASYNGPAKRSSGDSSEVPMILDVRCGA